ncbi:hypothetical protein ACJJTC_014884 [Scirpophaga incertulas]
MESTADKPIESITTNNKLDEVVVEESCDQEDATLVSNGIVVEDNTMNSKRESDAASTLFDSKTDASIVDSSETSDCKVTSTQHENVNVDPKTSDSNNVISQLTDSEITKDIEKLPESVDSNNVEKHNSHITEVQTEELVIETMNETIVSDNVRFETEVLVETNDTSPNSVNVDDLEVHDSSNNILKEINQSLESELLHTSATSVNMDNNNSSTGHEMFNKEELIDILEGNDQSSKNKEVIHVSNSVETKMALDQLTRLRTTNKKYHKEKSQGIARKKAIAKKSPKNVEENIVHALVRDWEDDDYVAEGTAEIDIQEITVQESVKDGEIKEEKGDLDTNVEDQDISVNKSIDDGQPQRRLGRVIKKKVIFDPDNPDTFTKSKNPSKNRELQNEREQPPVKKGKVESSPKVESKSPVSKLQWKKPSSKTSKQARRLTEIDKLLMDEGAVNMIYQLTAEAPKGKKNVKTKAEFIKKIQSSTPETKEMKFRERKKELVKSGDSDPKRILGGKHRASLSSSVKSPSISEDFETHSADDSIIYRRHSSSSYSSSCMSPRRLSDVDSSVTPNTVIAQANETNLKLETDQSSHCIPDKKSISNIINKNDCLSIKKKLNSKLSLALNKRKRDLTKVDKVPKKQLKLDDHIPKDDEIKYLTVKFDHRVAEICVNKSGSKYNTEVLKQICKSLQDIDSRTDIAVTILTSECGTLCSELDLSSLLNEDIDIRKIAADEIIKLVRDLICTVEQHSKMLLMGVWDMCSGLALALVALADASLAADRATFALTSGVPCAVISPGMAPLIASSRRLPQSVVDDMVIFDRRLSAFEALQYGLVSRVLSSGGFLDQLRVVARDIANQPTQTLILKKKLLKLGRVHESTFLSHLDEERKHMLSYWFSDEGQNSIRASTKDLTRTLDQNNFES